MMHLNGYFGNLSTWLVIAGGWLLISIVAALLMGAIARIGGGEERGE